MNVAPAVSSAVILATLIFRLQARFAAYIARQRWLQVVALHSFTGVTARYFSFEVATTSKCEHDVAHVGFHSPRSSPLRTGVNSQRPASSTRRRRDAEAPLPEPTVALNAALILRIA